MNAWNQFNDNHDDYQRNKTAAERLKQALSIVYVMKGQKVSDEKLAMVMTSLRGLLHEPELYTYLEHAADECGGRDFTPAKIKNEVYAIIRNKRPPVQTPDLTDDERTRSRQAALKTALWLHYEKGWSWERFGQEMFTSVLKVANVDTAAAFEAVKRKYPREEIAAWMESQK